MRGAVLLNPGASRADRGRPVARRLAADLDAPYVEANGEADAGGDIGGLARELADGGAERLVVAGGDGTLNRAVNGLMEVLDRVELAVLPLGTGNDLARSLDVPLDLEEAAALARDGTARPMDVGRLTGREERYFLNAAVGGIGGAINRELTPERKRRWGGLAYRIQAVAELRRLREYRVSVELADGETLEDEVYCVVAANGRRVGGGIPVAPGGTLDDGLLDLFAFTATGALATGRMLLAALRGNHEEDPDVWSRQAPAATVSATPAMWFDVDGELVGSEPVHFEVLPRALRVVAGPERAFSGFG